MTRKEKFLLLLLSSINFTHILDFMIMMPLGNYLMSFFGITTQQFAILVSAYSYSAFASGIIAAFVVDNFDRKKVLLFGYIGFIVGTLLCGFAPTFNLLIGARIMAGLFGGLIGAQVLAIVADNFPYEKRGRAMGYLMASFSVSSVIGVPFSLYLSNIFSWHAPFILVGVMGIVIVPLVIRFLPKMNLHLKAKQRLRIMQTLSAVFNNPASLTALGLAGLLMLGHFIIIPFLNPFMEFNVGFTREQIPLIYIVGGGVTLISAPIFGKLSDRYGKLKIYLITSILTLPFIFMITNMPAVPFYYVLVATGLWFIVSNGRSIAAQAMISNAVEPANRGSFMSFNSSLTQLFIGTGSFLAGLIVSNDANKVIHNYPLSGYVSIAILIICIFIGVQLNRQLNRSLKTNEEITLPPGTPGIADAPVQNTEIAGK